MRILATSLSTPARRRDQNIRRRIADQQFIKGNKALAENHLNGILIRVHREKAHVVDMLKGFNYLYDGLYRIAKYWPAFGINGFKIWRFRMEKLPYLKDDLPPGSGAYPFFVFARIAMSSWMSIQCG